MAKLVVTVMCGAALGAGAVVASPADRNVTTTVVMEGADSQIRAGTLAVSEDGLRLALGRKVKGGWTIEVDGRPLGTYKDVSPVPPGYSASAAFPGFKPLVFSADGAHLAYSAEVDGSWVVFRDGSPGKPYKDIGGPVLSRDGQRLVYAARQPRGWCVVVDGVEGKTYERVGPPAISPDGKRVAYAARDGGKELMVVDGVEGKRYDRLSIFPRFMARFFNPDFVLVWPHFSADGRVAYPAKNGQSWYVVVDTQESEGFQDVHDPTFSPDGKRLAFPAEKAGGRWAIVVDGKAFGAFDDTSEETFASDPTVRPVVFSPDSAHWAAPVKAGDKWALWVDGAAAGTETYDGVASPVFGPVGLHHAFVAKKNKQWVVVLDGVPQKANAFGIVRPVFAPDGSRLAWVAGVKPAGASEATLGVVVVDGVEGKGNEGMVSKLVFDDPAHLHYMGVAKKQVLLFREELQAGTPTP
jgi:hypothetical protein